MKFMRSMLKLAQYQVLEANNAEDGISLAPKHLPDLILIDIQFPVVALTSYAMQGDEEKSISAGCNRYIAKPIDTRNFLDILSGHLETH
jgi:CheY-like chemotaxis protein